MEPARVYDVAFLGAGGAERAPSFGRAMVAGDDVGGEAGHVGQRLDQVGLAGRYSRTLREATGVSPFRAEVAKQGRTARTECRSITRVVPPADVVERLDVDPDTDSVVRRENWYFADDEPVQLGITYAPWTDVADSAVGTSADLGHGSLYARFADLGHEIARVREEVTARMPTPEEIHGLDIPTASRCSTCCTPASTTTAGRSRSPASSCAPTSTASTTACPAWIAELDGRVVGHVAVT